MERLPVGVIGVGRMGFHHARVLAARPDVRLHLHDADPARLGAVAADLGAVPHATLDGLLREAAAVVVATPPDDHLATALKSLRAGADVLCEKPLARTAREARELVRQAKGRLMPGHVERFNPVVTALRRALARQPIRALTISRLGLTPPGHAGVDVLLDLGVHDLDLCALLAGSPIAEVRAETLGDDVAFALCRFASGAVARVEASWHCPRKVRQIRAWGRDVLLEADLVEGRLGRFTCDARGDVRGAEQRIPIVVGEALALELDAFLGAVRARGPMPIRAEDGLRAVEWAEQARASGAAARSRAAA